MITGPIYQLKIFTGYEKAFALGFNSHPRSLTYFQTEIQTSSQSEGVGLRGRLPPRFLGLAVCLQEGEFLGLLQCGRGEPSPRPELHLVDRREQSNHIPSLVASLGVQLSRHQGNSTLPGFHFARWDWFIECLFSSECRHKKVLFFSHLYFYPCFIKSTFSVS